MGELYRLDFASGKAYIGISAVSANRRFVQHRWCASHGSDLLVHRAWRKHGQPFLTILGTFEWDALLTAESQAIEQLGTLTPAGYNLTTGGRQPRMTPETAAKLSAVQKGRVFSLDHRAKLAAAKIGSKHSSKTLAKMAGAQKKRRRSEGFQPQKPRINHPRKSKSFTALRRAS